MESVLIGLINILQEVFEFFNELGKEMFFKSMLKFV